MASFRSGSYATIAVFSVG